MLLMYSEGDVPVDFLKKRLKADLELNPQSKAKARKVNFWLDGIDINLLNSSILNRLI